MGKRPREGSDSEPSRSKRDKHVKTHDQRSHLLNETFPKSQPPHFNPAFESLKRGVIRDIEHALKDENSARVTVGRLKQVATEKGITLAKGLEDKQQQRLLEQKKELMRSLAESPYIKGLQQKFITTVFPIGGSILMSAYNIYNATPPIMNEVQRNQLNDIGKKITEIPTKMLTGEWDIGKAYQEFVQILNDLTAFVSNKNNLNIVINIAGVILESVHPLGSFIKSALNDVLKSDMPQNLQEVALRGLGAIAKNYDKLENGLESTAKQGIELAKNDKLEATVSQSAAPKRHK